MNSKFYERCIKIVSNLKLNYEEGIARDVILNELDMLEKQATDYQIRFNKAIEYINKRMVEEGEYYFRKAKHFKNTEFGKDLLKILEDNEQEEYTLTPDENGTTNINGVLYRVDKK